MEVGVSSGDTPGMRTTGWKRAGLLVSTLGLAVLPACRVVLRGHEVGDPPAAPVATSLEAPRTATYSVAWSTVDGGAIPRNVECELLVTVMRDGEAAGVERLDVSAWMPDHNHGLVQLPEVLDLGGGRYRVEGLLLHMRGRWELRFGIFDPGVRETVVVELEL